ncbi:PHA/PHB synthase family protein [Ponticoccus alexandrii]|uniref:Class I poly(R)-hydroxyalkanoic acid synthase n=1 Tax=Ponticoccus alexandrii TaxID=1943633 RepID=A0ABX7F722_9RHOB|nr:class I poly(R)-hydroxyalkanoic acid synthase [Ponticoccus alexandrii]ETA52583.2 poly(R)-hydroxyalkanoic acid synthase [Rhodobacteraceae bacterium PD-2]QRF65602.1 class I poly(R)-hydroxyalkanoic acid synthase [Ponticoccus alexandrii]
MTTNEVDAGEKQTRLEANLARVEELSQRLIAALTKRHPTPVALNGPDASLYTKAAQSYWQEWVNNPAKLIEQQVSYWGKTVTHFVEAQQALAQGKLQAPANPGPTDKRFRNPAWDTHPWFNYVKQQYLINAESIHTAIEGLDEMDAKEKRRLRYFSQQIVDMLAPTNFLATNPDALMKAVETEGESLVRGLENLVSDLEANNGELIVRLVDESAFEIGENIATAKGEVVYRNRMMEIIQYSPTTEQVQEVPIVLFPPWINKFYILDLKPQNSLIRWVVDQGYTLFVVSWINPHPTYRDVGLEHYVEEGFLKTIDIAKEICGVEKVNAVGYCIAGTTLAVTLALMKKRGDASVRSATFFTALTDFSDQGEFTPFLQDDFADAIEQEIEQEGVLPSFIMARTFSFLRSNDLIYGPAIRSYMMGETPPAFDLLYWNGDGANLPGRMFRQYLRGLCQRNEFAEGRFEFMGETLSVKDVDVPLMSIATESDHIARAADVYRGVQMMGAKQKQFVLGQSGHIAGIVNPPGKDKYGHYVNADLGTDFEGWKAGAEHHAGSWWPHWEAWLRRRSGKKVPARAPGDSSYEPLAPAPGTYVRVKAAKQIQ